MKTCWECGGEMQGIKGKPYHYRESGLDNVYLHGIIQYECKKCCECGPEIPDIEKLHLVIGKALVCKQHHLNAKEIVFLRKELGLKSKEMAELLSVTAQKYSKWENSKDTISPVYDKYLRSIYVLNADHKTGKVLHDGIGFLRHIIPLKKPPASKEKKIKIRASEWIKPFEIPFFRDEAFLIKDAKTVTSH